MEDVFVHEDRRVLIRFRFEDVIKETLEKLSKEEGGQPDEGNKACIEDRIETIAAAGLVRGVDG